MAAPRPAPPSMPPPSMPPPSMPPPSSPRGPSRPAEAAGCTSRSLHFGMDNVSFCWKDITVTAAADGARRCRGGERAQILKQVSGYVNKGELVAVMGPSSAGKSTLFNALTYQNLSGLQISGGRYANGIPMSPMQMTSIAGYIPQFDVFIGTLTVREHLSFLATLRLGNVLTPEERRQRIDEVMKELGLLKCADTLIGIRGRVKGISGGEMRRLSFASEVLSDPLLLFCDEATSGLDSWMAENVVDLMRDMASKGRAILCVIHQPSSEVYHKFDRVLLMAEGRNVFMGDVADAKQFFTEIGYPCPDTYNPSDHYIHQVSIFPRSEDESRSRIEAICNAFHESKYAHSVSKEVESQISDRAHVFGNLDFDASVLTPYRASWAQQFRALLWRSWHSIKKEPKVVQIRIFEVIFLSLLVGIIYLDQDYDQEGVQNIDGAMFWVCMNTFFSTYTSMLTIFTNEIPVFLREHNNGLYRTDTYFISKQLADTPLLLVTPVLFMCIFYWMVGLNPTAEHFFVAVLITVLVNQTAVGLGIFMSCVSPNLMFALAVGPTVLVPLMQVGGFFLNEDTIQAWLAWCKYISPFFYGNEAFNINQWRDVEEIACDREDEAACLSDGQEVLDFYAFNESHMWFDIGMLLVLSLACRFFGYCALFYRARRTVK